MARRTKAMIEAELQQANEIIDELSGTISLLERENAMLKSYSMGSHTNTMMITVQRLAESASTLAEAAVKGRY